MYNTLKEYADTYNPLTRTAELSLINKYSRNPTKLFEMMLKHNARYIVKYVNLWKNSYNNDLDEATSVVILSLAKKFEGWNSSTESYYYHIKYLVRSALRGNYEDPAKHCEFEDMLETIEFEYNDTQSFEEMLKRIPTLDERAIDMLRRIYGDTQESVTSAGKNVYGIQSASNSSRRHRNILKSLNEVKSISEYF